MQIQIASDLHLEFIHPKNQKKFIKKLQSDAEIIVLAGDICSHHKLVETLSIFSEMYKHVIYVNGNHELYGTHIDRLRDKKQFLPKNVHWLDNTSVIIENQRFIGCTLWFPYDSLNQIYEKEMNDFYSILNFREYVYKENENSVKYLTENIKEKDIVITHHLPSNKSIHSKYFDSQINRFFVCEMDEVIKKNKPSYWGHGHTHETFEYKLYDTQIIANPHGTPDERNDFEYNKIISI